MDKLLAAFQTFFREHPEHWVERFDYRKAGPQLLLQAFLQRIVNGGGPIEREYGLGRWSCGRTTFPTQRGLQALDDRPLLELRAGRGCGRYNSKRSVNSA